MKKRDDSPKIGGDSENVWEWGGCSSNEVVHSGTLRKGVEEFQEFSELFYSCNGCAYGWGVT